MSDTAPAPPAVTIAFGRFADGGRLAGRYHPTAGEPARGGVVLCGPGGIEDIWTYATMRALAERLAARGVPVLRFDYHGQGDSASDDRAPRRVQAWKDSISFAIDELLARSGARSMTLFGLRLGATLAATVAAERGGLLGLALWAAVSGRVFLREFRAYRVLNPPAPAPAGRQREGEEDAAGFTLTSETIADLADLDVTKLTQRPADRALVLPKDEATSDDKATTKLRSLGVDVRQRNVPGYRAMMADPLKTVRPNAALDILTGWLVESANADPSPSSATLAAQAPVEPPVVILTRAPYATDTTVREQPVRFGPDDRLFGILTQPLETGARARTAIVFLTVAYHHRIGTHRTHVTYAREAAARGFSAFRFDVRGVGESLSPDGASHPYSFEPVQDVIAAIDALTKRGVERVVLAGLCSGAFLAYHSALADPRARGVALLNPQVFYFKQGASLEIGRGSARSTQSYYRKLTSSESWRRLLRGEVQAGYIANAILGRVKRRVDILAEDTLARLGRPPRTPSVRRDFLTLARRGTRALLVFSAVDEGIDYVEAHLGRGAKALRRYPEFEMKVIDGPDHTFVPAWSQERVCEVLCEELETHFG